MHEAGAVVDDALEAMGRCECGHLLEWHRHDRRGSDCSRCDCLGPTVGRGRRPHVRG